MILIIQFSVFKLNSFTNCLGVRHMLDIILLMGIQHSMKETMILTFMIYIYISVIIIYTYHIVHSSLVLIYLVTESLYILTAFIHFPQPSWANSDNHKSNLLLCVFVFEVQLYYTMLVPVMQHSDLVALYISKWSPW